MMILSFSFVILMLYAVSFVVLIVLSFVTYHWIQFIFVSHLFDVIRIRIVDIARNDWLYC
jgi:hypothetical protein